MHHYRMLVTPKNLIVELEASEQAVLTAKRQYQHTLGLALKYHFIEPEMRVF